MKALVIGCGRVGSNIALQLEREGWDVTAVDEKEEAIGRLGDHWAGGFVLGHGMDTDVLREAGIEEADAVVVATDGDNTNIVIGQVAQQRFDNQCVVVRVLDPVHLLELRKENLEIVEVQIDEDDPAAGKRVEKLDLPEGSRLISIMRNGRSEIAVGATELLPGDQVLAILQPGKEDELRRVLLKS